MPPATHQPDVLVIGATSGIARACVAAYAARGARLLLTSRDRAEADRIAADATVRGAAAADAIAFDPADLASHRRFIEQVAGMVPGGPSVILIAYGTMEPQAEAQGDPAACARQILVNLTSVVVLGEALLPRLRPGGTLAVISSVAGDRGRQSNYLYGCTKAGLSAWLQGLRNRAFREGRHVLTIKPGFVATPMTRGLLKEGSPLVAQPETVARDILRAIDRGRDVVYTPWFWRPVMALIRSIPESVFKRLRL
ncbi:MAG: SDR family oxidoreductase [Planctomycetia bacterium]|nr:SDR family oxidoreductase [Planctomycetia bacterium]